MRFLKGIIVVLCLAVSPSMELSAACNVVRHECEYPNGYVIYRVESDSGTYIGRDFREALEYIDSHC